MRRALVCALLVALTGCTGAPIRNVEHATLHDVRHVSAATSTILIAGEKQGWDMRVVEPGRIKGTLNVRNRHVAVVDIVYTPQEYSILYADSDNLGYQENGRRIHKNYNILVAELAQEIFDTSEIVAVLASWVGRPMDELVTIWGPPDKQFTLTNGDSVIEYRHDSTTGGGQSTTMLALSGGIVQTTRNSWCQVSFPVTQAGIVSDFLARGNDCRRYATPAPY